MIEEYARVVALEDGFAVVETERRSSCEACAVNKGCGTATLAKVLGRRRTQVRALNAGGAAVGDEVVVGIREDALVRGSLSVYAIPLLALIGGGLVGETLSAPLSVGAEAASIVGGLAGLAAGLAWLRGHARGMRADPRFQPVVLRRVGPVASR